MGGWGSRRDEQIEACNFTQSWALGKKSMNEAAEKRDEMGLAMQGLVDHLKNLGFMLRTVGNC